MAIIDNTLAQQTPQFNPATPLMQAAKIQEAQTEQRAQQFKQMQVEIGSEARGLTPFVNTPEFPAKWAETADRMLQKGLMDPQTHQKWRNTPSPLLLKQMISQTEDPTLSFRKDEAVRDQGNQDRTYAQNKLISDRNYAMANEGPVEKAGQREAVLEKYGIDKNSPEGKNYLIAGQWTGPGATGPKIGLQPTFGVGGDGKPAAIQFADNGTAVQTKMPDGFSLAKEPIKVDAGTHFVLLDPQTRQEIARVPKDIAGVEKAKVVGDETGKAQVALPQMLATSEQILKTIDDIEKHPGKEYSLGIWSKAPTVPGTSQADFRAAAGQLKGQTFLQAYNTLKGGGAITDIEGAKAENALARLDQAQSVEAYDAALKDFRKVIKAGVDRAKAKAGGSSDKPPVAARFKQLIEKDGLSEKAAYAKLHEEGYN